MAINFRRRTFNYNDARIACEKHKKKVKTPKNKNSCEWIFVMEESTEMRGWENCKSRLNHDSSIKVSVFFFSKMCISVDVGMKKWFSWKFMLPQSIPVAFTQSCLRRALFAPLI